MAAKSEPPISPNKFVEGSYTKGDSAWTVDATGNVTLTSWRTSLFDIPDIEMIRAIDFSAGDEVKVVITKLSGTLSAAQFTDISVCGVLIVQNSLWGTGTTAVSKTTTAPSASTSKYLEIKNRTGTATLTDYKFKVDVYVNGTKVFQEV